MRTITSACPPFILIFVLKRADRITHQNFNTMVRYLAVTLFLVSFLNDSLGQWPLGASLFAQMNRMQRDLDRMVANMRANMRSMQVNMDTNMHAINERMARQRQYILGNGNRNAYITRNYGTGGTTFSTDNGLRNGNQNVHITENYGTGGTTFSTANGGTGYVYNSPDGSVNIFSYSSGPQYSGSLHYSGPDGTYSRNW
ncbi:uncharacterized protein LOC123547864 [Mercenaria mercenaria]|uniref:uncharacterized protein LOC123547864 n=1 Tax=Mercenaria mercenaria TaxID=6596 RepID=UPI00234F9E59|nr:uncharacterized protein LOC123547864 [Mercenaria mercenaria]